jgi:cytochrome c-type biogenesis protein CcmE
MKFKYLVIVLSLASLLVLYILASFSQPTVVPFSKIPLNEGKQIMVQGIVAVYQTTTTGSTLVTLRNNDDANTTTITLYVEGPLTLEYGDLVQVTGTVQEYNNQWELAVANPQAVVVLEPWGDRSSPLWQLAQNPGRYVDTNVNVTGIVGTVTSTTFKLQDSVKDCSVTVTCKRPSNASFSKGDLVAVKARFLYDKTTLSYLLQVTDATQDIQVRTQG